MPIPGPRQKAAGRRTEITRGGIEMIFIILGMIFLGMYLYKKEPCFPIGFILAEVGLVGVMWMIALELIK